MGKFVMKETKNGVKFDLKAGNGEVIATSEVYSGAAGVAFPFLRRLRWDTHSPAGQAAYGGFGAASRRRLRHSRSTLRAALPLYRPAIPKKRPLRSRFFCYYSRLNSASCRPSLRSSAHWIFHSLAKSSRLLPFRSCTHLVSLVSVIALGSASRLAIHRIYP